MSSSASRLADSLLVACALVLFAAYGRGQWSLTTRFARELWTYWKGAP